MRPKVAEESEYEERHGKGNTDNAPQQAMQILEPENALELANVHVRVDLLKFRRLLIHLEDPLPFRVSERWQPAEQGAPVRHRQAGSGQAGHAAKDYHRENEGAADEKPGRDLAIAVGRGHRRNTNNSELCSRCCSRYFPH